MKPLFPTSWKSLTGSRSHRTVLWIMLILLVLMAAWPASASAQEPIVRVTVEPEVVPVGEAIALEVTVLVPTWFPKPPGYPSFELANTITRLPPDSSYPTNARIGRDTWSGIVRTYQVYPLAAAIYRLGGQTMQVTYTDPEKSKPVTVEVAVPEVEFRARVPAGAEALDPYVAGRRLTLEREIEGEAESLEAGDALVVRYVVELEGLPAIFLPALVPSLPTGAPGLSVYAEQPVIEESEDGETARRSEKLTFVFEAGGDFTVPSAEIRWWNTETSEVAVAAVTALTVSVAGPPIPSPVDAELRAKPAWRTVLAWAAALAVILLALSRHRACLLSRWTAYQDRRRRSEGYAFSKVRKALRGGSPRAVYRALLVWLERVEPGLDARQFANRHGDPKLARQIEELSRSLYAEAEGAVNLRELETSLAAARRRRARTDRRGRSFTLPSMNSP